MTQKTALEVFDAAFGEGRPPRSEEYRLGVIACLHTQIEGGIRLNCPYALGTAQADAWYAGQAEGHVLARAALKEASAESVTTPNAVEKRLEATATALRPATDRKLEASSLSVWHGPGENFKRADDPRWQGLERPEDVRAFACASSQADLRRLIEGYCGHTLSRHQFETYWKPVWPSPMKGVERERGLWLLFDWSSNPVKVA